MTDQNTSKDDPAGGLECLCKNPRIDHFTDIPFVAKCMCGGYRKIKPEDMPT